MLYLAVLMSMTVHKAAQARIAIIARMATGRHECLVSAQKACLLSPDIRVVTTCK